MKALKSLKVIFVGLAIAAGAALAAATMIPVADSAPDLTSDPILHHAADASYRQLGV
ncbi:MAG: hypothetical protein JNM79_15975 [Burkholderiales bacterium]|nr:hypothetical protein [Burkholderiales bacterium]